MKAFQRLSTRLMTLALAAAASLVALGTANAVVIANVTGGFKGTTQVDVCALNQCFRPPDTMGAVGTTQFLETTNGANTVYDKNTGAILLVGRRTRPVGSRRLELALCFRLREEGLAARG